MAMAHVILKAAFKHFTRGIAAGGRGKKINMYITNCRKYNAVLLWVAIIICLYKHKKQSKPLSLKD